MFKQLFTKLFRSSGADAPHSALGANTTTLRRLGVVKRDTSIPLPKRQRGLRPGGRHRVYAQFR